MIPLIVLALLAVTPPALGQSYDAGLKAYEAGDFDAARRAWQPLAEDGDPVAQYSLGKLFERGGGTVEPNLEKAAHWYQEAARQGIAASQNNLALMYAQGRGVDRDLTRAIELWLKAAKQNHAMAQYNLALAYFRGEGLEKDEQEAAGWFRRAADSGLGEAQYAMGQMNRLGLILPKDQGKALHWYRMAAEQGHREAKSQVHLLEAAGVVARAPGVPWVSPAALMTGTEEKPGEIDSGQETAAGPKSVIPIDEAPVAGAAAPQLDSAGDSPPREVSEQEHQKRRPAADTLATAAGAEPSEPKGPLTPRRKPAVPQLTMQQTAATQPAENEADAPDAEIEEMSAGAAAMQAASPPTQKEEVAQAETTAPVEQAAQNESQTDEPKTERRRGVQVWLASERSKQAADQLWPLAKKRYPELLAKAKPEIVRADLGSGGVFYRLMVGPLKSREAARDLCALMRLQDEDAFCKLLPE